MTTSTVRRKYMIHVYGGNTAMRDDILKDAEANGFDTEITFGKEKNPFSVKIFSTNISKLDEWIIPFENLKTVYVFYYDDHPKNISLKPKSGRKRVSKPLSNLTTTTGTIPEATVSIDTGATTEANYNIKYLDNGQPLTSAMSMLYRFPPISKPRPNIGIVGLDSYVYETDFPLYWSALGLISPNIPIVNIVLIDGAVNTPSGDSESNLDVQMVGGNCTNANISLYLTENTDGGPFYDCVLAAISNNKIVTMSWAFSGNMTSVGELLQYFASQGGNFFESSGDTGSSGFYEAPYYCSYPSVIACGGTSITAGTYNYNAYASTTTETAWGTFSGGGISYLPSADFQRSTMNRANTTGVRLGNRCVPDIAACANGVVLYSNGVSIWPPYVETGTSCVAPMMAALCGILQPKVFLSPIFYANLNSDIKWYRDITEGNNGAYLCQPGYDMVTGIGSIDGIGLQQLLQRLGVV